jgi:hypothetical protein
MAMSPVHTSFAIVVGMGGRAVIVRWPPGDEPMENLDARHPTPTAAGVYAHSIRKATSPMNQGRLPGGHDRGGTAFAEI